MTPEQWARVEELYHAAGAQPAASRAEWLARACGSDGAVRREVESLLAQHASSNNLLDEGALSHISGSGGDGDNLIGQRVGNFEILDLIDEGGMGQVYRARELTLPRDVAVKVIPAAVAHDPARRARFRQEAELLASLSHPHIAHVYAFVEDAGRSLLVMELVPGRTLAERIARGSIPLAEALPIARQIADALDAAHEQGVVHRDLKPANIKVTPDGAVKVLDFGLAAPLRRAPGPTARDGAYLFGTAAYLSPERARGESGDRRGDIWAFGCLLFEMLTGRQAFSGTTVTETLTGILEREPDWSTLPASLPDGVHALLRRCLDKDPRRRLRDIGEARVQLDVLMAQPAAVSTRSRRMIGVAAAVIVLAAVGGAAWWAGTTSRGAASAGQTAHLFLAPSPADALPSRPTRTDVAISPDGRVVVFSGLKDGKQRLYSRSLDRLEATPIPGTENTNSPFFSPDGMWLGFWQGTLQNGALGELKKVRLDGTPPVSICRTPLLFGATWGANGAIVFANARGGLRQVPAAGGEQRAFTELDEAQNENSHRLPHFLPDGRSILFTITRSQGARNDSSVRIVARSLTDRAQRTLIAGGMDGRYVDSGHIVYARSNALMAVPFEPATLTVTGQPVTLVEGILQASGPWVPGGVTAGETGAAQFDVSASGSLVYVPGRPYAEPRQSLVWVDRRGGETALPTPPHSYLGPRISPDGHRVLVYALGFDPSLWLFDFASRTFAPTMPQNQGFWPVWSADGQHITFGQERPRAIVASMGLDGTGVDIVVHDNGMPGVWSPTGSTLIFTRLLPSSGWEIREWSREHGDRRLLPPSDTPSLERYPTLSPDGHWLAYASNDSGHDEVYIRAYPGATQRQQISTQGGMAPAWSRDGREFFYQTGVDGKARLMAAGFDLASGSLSGSPRPLFEGPYKIGSPLRSYDPAPDGRRFLMVKLPPPGQDDPVNTEIAVVLNWFDELKRLAPAKP